MNVVLVHGFTGTSSRAAFTEGYFRCVPAHLSRVYGASISVLEPLAGEGHCRVVGQTILRAVESALERGVLKGDAPIHFIGHSQGGLSLRAALSDMDQERAPVRKQHERLTLLLNRSDMMHTYTSIGTPHAGTVLADHAMQALRFAPETMPQVVTSAARQLRRLSSHAVLNGLSAAVDSTKELRFALVDMCVGNAGREQRLRDVRWRKHHNVRYHCISSTAPGMSIRNSLYLSKPWLAPYGPHDGVVSFSSSEWSTWDSGVVSLTDTLPGWRELDHLSQIGHFFGHTLNNRRCDDFDGHLQRYADLVAWLSVTPKCGV